MNNEEALFRDCWWKIYHSNPKITPGLTAVNKLMAETNPKIRRTNNLPGRLVKVRTELLEWTGFHKNDMGRWVK